MHGFYLQIKNGLLEQRHIKAMGSSVWLFMWFLDSMTSVSEEGIGKVLGGKPIKYEEVKKHLGITQRTYRRWTSILINKGYIETIVAPYGLVIHVNKAFKVFGQRSAKNGTPKGYAKNGTPPDKNGTPNKTIQLDKTTKDYSEPSSQDIPEMIKLFENINPLQVKKWYGNTTQRKSIENLLALYGQEKLEKIIKLLPRTNQMKYAPRITTPYALELKCADLEVFLKSKTSNLIVV